jgi:hypothetical protein
MKGNKAGAVLAVSALIALVCLGLSFEAEYGRPISARFAAMGVVGQRVSVINYSFPRDRERHTHYANAYRRWQGDLPLAQAIWLPDGALSVEELERVRRAFPESAVMTYEPDAPSSAKFNGRAVFVFSDSLEAEGLDPSVRQTNADDDT